MSRRQFLKQTGWLSVYAAAPSPLITYSRKKKMKKFSPGDKIGLITPASFVEPDRIETAQQQVMDLGFTPVLGKYLDQRYGYLAGSDTQRLEDLHDMYRNSKVKAIWCIRGGYGCTRLLPYVDYDLIKRNPKPLIGYSDITALHVAIHQECGQITFHGPNASPVMNDYSMDYFRHVFLEEKSSLPIKNTEDYAASNYDEVVVIRPGSAQGRLVGGNLSLLAAMCGTPWQLRAKKKIVYLEDIGEDTYRIDRMLTQLIQSGSLENARGLLLGQFKNCHPKNPEKSLSLNECLKDRLVPLGIPAVFGMSFGHIKHQFTLPFGAEARMEAEASALTIDLGFWDR